MGEKHVKNDDVDISDKKLYLHLFAIKERNKNAPKFSVLIDCAWEGNVRFRQSSAQ